MTVTGLLCNLPTLVKLGSLRSFGSFHFSFNSKLTCVERWQAYNKLVFIAIRVVTPGSSFQKESSRALNVFRF